MKKLIFIALLFISTLSFSQTVYGRRAGHKAGRPMGGYHKRGGGRGRKTTFHHAYKTHPHYKHGGV